MTGNKAYAPGGSYHGMFTRVLQPRICHHFSDHPPPLPPPPPDTESSARRRVGLCKVKATYLNDLRWPEGMALVYGLA